MIMMCVVEDSWGRDGTGGGPRENTAAVPVDVVLQSCRPPLRSCLSGSLLLVGSIIIGKSDGGV